MADSENSTETTAAAAAKPSGQADASPAAKQPKPRGRGGVIFAALLALIAAGGTGYIAYRLQFEAFPELETDREKVATLAENLQSVQEGESQRAEQLAAEIQALRSELQLRSNQLTALEERLAQSNAEFSEKIDAVIESTSSLYENIDQQPSDWELDDVSLLLLIGGKQLKLTRNPEAVLPIWQSAVDQVGQVADPQLLVVRAQLNKEIELLKVMKVTNLEEISNQLLELIQIIDELPIRTQLPDLSETSDEPVEEQSEEQPASGVRGTLDAVWTDLKSLIRVTRISESEPLPINPNQKDELTERLKLALAAAQLAALQEEQSVYQANLEFVKSVLQDQFDVAAHSVAAFANALDDLLGTPVAAQVPDVSGSYDLLQEILARTPVE